MLQQPLEKGVVKHLPMRNLISHFPPVSLERIHRKHPIQGKANDKFHSCWCASILLSPLLALDPPPQRRPPAQYSACALNRTFLWRCAGSLLRMTCAIETNHPGSSGIIWDHLGSAGVICHQLASSDLIGDHKLQNNLKSSGIIWVWDLWAHLRSSGLIWDHLESSELI